MASAARRAGTVAPNCIRKGIDSVNITVLYAGDFRNFSRKPTKWLSFPIGISLAYQLCSRKNRVEPAIGIVT
jgi:hypothetical protein